jgi:hypothetical protein
VRLLLLILFIGFAYSAYAQTGSRFDGYRDVNISTSSTLTVNDRPTPSALSSSKPSNSVAVFTAGYNFPLAPGYVLGIGTNISPASGQAQQAQVQALNKTISLSGIQPLYSYGFFLAPGLEIGDGLAYLKAGTQSQINNSNTGPNFNGYLLGLGYKHLIYQSVYLFGEANYASYGSQTKNQSMMASGQSINASVTTKPQGSRYLLGLGYQF